MYAYQATRQFSTLPRPRTKMGIGPEISPPAPILGPHLGFLGAVRTELIAVESVACVDLHKNPMRTDKMINQNPWTIHTGEQLMWSNTISTHDRVRSVGLLAHHPWDPRVQRDGHRRGPIDVRFCLWAITRLNVSVLIFDLYDTQLSAAKGGPGRGQDGGGTLNRNVSSFRRHRSSKLLFFLALPR